MSLQTFFDHLTSLNSSRWGTIASGSGSVTQSGSKVAISTPSANDAAAIYLKDPIDTTVSQLIAICFSFTSTVAGLPFYFINKASAPAAEGATAFNARRIASATAADAVAFTFLRWSDAGTQNSWSTSAANWGTGASRYSVTPIGAGDYYYAVLEIDGPNSQWRLHGYCLQASAWGDAKTQGLVNLCTSDWTAWSATRSVTDGLYLVIGDPMNDSGTLGIDVAWVRVAAGTKEYAFGNGKDDGGSYSIKRFWMLDGKFLVPEDRSTDVLSGNVKDPWVIDDGAGTVHWFYTDVTNTSIRRATASLVTGTVTYQNTLVSFPANHTYGFPCVVYTPWEGSGYEWQCVMQDLDATDSNHVSLRLFTASTPGGTWTDRGIVLSYGSGADEDAQGCLSPVIQHRNSVYEVFYSGQYDPGVAINGSFTTVSGMRATGAGLTSAGAGLLTLAKDGAGARLPYTDVQQALSANLSGITASMADTDGFEVADMPVYFDQDTTDNNWANSRIQAYSVDASLTLYHKMTGLTTAAGATAFGPLSGPQNIRSIKQQADGSWHVYVTVVQVTKFNTTIGAVFQEETYLLIVPAGTDLLNMSPSHYSWIDSPTPYRNTFGFGHSAENLSLVNGPLVRSLAPHRAHVFSQAVNRSGTY